MNPDLAQTVRAGLEPALLVQRAWLELFAAWLRAFGARGGDVTIYFPFGQGFTLYANPATNWWSQLATAQPEAERRIVTHVASYGKQIGWMMDMLIDLAEGSDKVSAADLADLKRLRDDINLAKLAQ